MPIAKDCDLNAGVEGALASALRVREAARKPGGILVILTGVSRHGPLGRE